MPDSALTSGKVGNLVLDYYDWLPQVIARTGVDVEPVKDPACFSPGFVLPEMGDDVRRFFAVAEAEWRDLGEYRSHRLSLLDLTRNPGTHTTKTFASVLIVARAVEYIRRTGERIVIFSPTSANKGTALRDAVQRAIGTGLVTADQLRVVILAPRSCWGKLRQSGLADDPELRARNPVLLYQGEVPEDVKALGKAFARDHAEAVGSRLGVNLWFSLELRNYVIADAARALLEHDAAPTPSAGRRRVQAHAVSSAFGLLGYNEGREALEAAGRAGAEDRPGCLLVQHLGTPDMVLNLYSGDFSRDAVPAYAYSRSTGLYEQSADPHFPATTYDPHEVLDPTFYTHRPATSPAMNALIERFGGGGIVVSLHECLARYPAVRAMLADTGRPLPADPRTLREWSLTMAMTGTLNAVDLGLIPPETDLVVHGSGSYTTADYDVLDTSATAPVHDVDDVVSAVLAVS